MTADALLSELEWKKVRTGHSLSKEILDYYEAAILPNLKSFSG